MDAPADVSELIEAPRTARVLGAARMAVRYMFERYRQQNVDNWEPGPMPDGWVPERRQVGR